MKRNRLILSLVLVLVVGLLAGCGQNNEEQTASQDGETKTVVMGLDDTFAPMGFRDDNNEIVGFDVDLAKEVAERNNWNLVLQPIEWSMKENELNAGNIDLIWNGYSITEERAEVVNFSDPYLENAQIVVVLADSDINTLDDLEGRAVATQAESSSLDAARTQEGLIESLKDGQLVEYATFTEVFNDLESGRSEAIIVDEVMARYYMGNKNPEDYRILEEDLGPEEFAVGMRKEDTELVETVNTAFEDMKADGTYDEIYRKWFAE